MAYVDVDANFLYALLSSRVKRISCRLNVSKLFSFQPAFCGLCNIYTYINRFYLFYFILKQSMGKEIPQRTKQTTLGTWAVSKKCLYVRACVCVCAE